MQARSPPSAVALPYGAYVATPPTFVTVRVRATPAAPPPPLGRPLCALCQPLGRVQLGGARGASAGAAGGGDGWPYLLLHEHCAVKVWGDDVALESLEVGWGWKGGVCGTRRVSRPL